MLNKRWLLLLLLLPAVCTICLAAGNNTEAPVNQSPNVTTIVGSGAATLESTRYPEFYAYNSPGYEACGERLKTLSGTLKGNYSTFQMIPGLQTIFRIPAECRSNSRILFTWTVRIETGSPALIPIAPKLCPVFPGITYQRFTGGEVHTQLFINGNPMQPVATMTIPGTALADNAPPPRRSDPTLTGSCLLSPRDLGSTTFPESLNVDVRWFNNMGGFQAVSPDQMRELIITVIPQ